MGIKALIGAVLASLAALAACSSFDASDEPAVVAGGDAGAEAATGAEASAGRFCPNSSVQDTKCWDFDDGLEPGGELGAAGSALALDKEIYFSPGYSLRASTPAVKQGGAEVWARIGDSHAPVPSGASLELRIRIDKGFDRAEVAALSFEESSSSTRHEFTLVVDGAGALEVFDSTFVDNTNTSPNPYASVASIGVEKWAHVSMDVSFTGFPGTSASRKLVVKVDGSTKIDDTRSGDLKSVNATRARMLAGINYVNSFSSDKAAQSVHIDDVLVRWWP